MIAKIYEAAAALQSLCENHRWRFCFIGGIAVLRWSDPRATKDADLTVVTEFIDEEKYVDTLLVAFIPRRSDAREFALHNRVVLLQHPNGVPLDVGLGGLPFEVNCVARSSIWDAAEGCALRTCSAEDLIVHKAFASRGQDWVDVERILQRQGSKLDRAQIFRELTPLVELKEEPAIITRLQGLWKKHVEA